MNKVILPFERKECLVDFYNPNWCRYGVASVCRLVLRRYWIIRKSARKIEIVLVDKKVPESFEVTIDVGEFTGVYFLCIDGDCLPSTSEQRKAAETFIDTFGKCFMYVNLVSG